ncbi:MAG TPA: hypothetical protein VMZ04_04815 [Anaerolineae bacterium]|nr:hypothetical protein [Anaerolineae bacterium]
MTNIKTQTRRDFICDISMIGIGISGFGAFLQSCSEKGIAPTSGLAKAYIDGLLAIIEKIRKRELPKITKAASLAVQARLQGHKLYAKISGGMIPFETDTSRPGSPRVYITTNINEVSWNDVIITNDPEAVRGFSEQFVKVVGITTPSIPNNNTPPGTLENMGALRIEDVSDIIIYCHVPYTDGILNVQGIDIPICPASGVIHSLIYYALAAEIVEGLTRSGIYPPIG